MASKLYPRFKLKWHRNKCERATTADHLLEGAKSVTPTPPTSASELTTLPSKRQKVNDILNFMSDDNNNVPTITTTSALT